MTKEQANEINTLIQDIVNQAGLIHCNYDLIKELQNRIKNILKNLTDVQTK